jgi:hypothetical protein
MPRYRKKPVVIEAKEYKGENKKEIIDFIGYENLLIQKRPNYPIIIQTLEGDMKVEKGDFVIKGVNGEFYPCKPDIFYKTYEQVEEAD